MKIVIFGASGMVGQGVLRECLLDPAIDEVVIVVRASLGKADPKLREIVLSDISTFDARASSVRDFDACLFAVGVSAAGTSEADYRHVTYELAMAVAGSLLPVNPNLTFLFVSGEGTDGSGSSTTMWARVKGETENALAALPFRAVYLLRPGFIRPLHGIKSKTQMYRWVYAVVGPLFPLLDRLMPGTMTTTELLGRAVISIAKHGAPKKVLQSRDLRQIGDAEMAARPA